ncbi:uncharacterized protein TNCV_1372611 [Trichonephila clavipes]|nr:uncharacterized protein TNCV_1372611 [Trichonephila clavipes]
MISYVVELLDDWNGDVPSWKYPRNLESSRMSSPGFDNDSKMMLPVRQFQGRPCTDAYGTLVYMLVGLSDVFHSPQLTVACD